MAIRILARGRTGRRCVWRMAIVRLMAGRGMIRGGVLRDLTTSWRIRSLVPAAARTRMPNIGLLRHGICLWLVRLTAAIVTGTEARPKTRTKRLAAVLTDDITDKDKQQNSTDRNTNTDSDARAVRQARLIIIAVAVATKHDAQWMNLPTWT